MGKKPVNTERVPDSGPLIKYFITVRDYYYKILDKLWSRIPNFLGTIIATLIVFIAGSTMRGDWLLILVHFIRSARPGNSTDNLADSQTFNMSNFSLEQFHLQDLPFFLLMNFAVSYIIYFVICGFLQWYFYIRQYDHPENWKCQPKKYLDPDLERHEILLGTFNVGLGAIIFGTVACYIYNGGVSSLYFNFGDYGYLWLFASIPLLFLYQDATAYYGHRMMHYPYFYRRFHKVHHYYKQPTTFSATAFHPAEFIFFQMLLILPTFVVPLNVFVYVIGLLYIYYYGLIDHSGIKMDALWPWQPDTIFHDNHHQYFNINFGFNLEFWDKFHGTYKYIDNSLVGKSINTKIDPKAFRTDEETLKLEAELIDGKSANETS